MNDNGLTPREHEIARLVARGLTNREIADLLVVSPETVKTHVSHILRKLDLRSRHQVAAWYHAEHQKSPAGGLKADDRDDYRRRRWPGRAARPATIAAWRGAHMGVVAGNRRWLAWSLAAGLALLLVTGAGFALAGGDGGPAGGQPSTYAAAGAPEIPAPKPLMNVYLPRDPEPQTWGAEPTPTEIPSSGVIPPGDFAVLQRRASPAEMAKLADGVITREELLTAFMAAHTCTLEVAQSVGGVTMHEPDLSGPEPRFGGMSSSDARAFGTVSQAHGGCVETYYNEVLAAWGMAISAAGHQPLFDAIGRCLEGRGYSVPAGANRIQLAEAVGRPGDAIPDFYACEEQASRAAEAAG